MIDKIYKLSVIKKEKYAMFGNVSRGGCNE